MSQSLVKLKPSQVSVFGTAGQFGRCTVTVYPATGTVTRMVPGPGYPGFYPPPSQSRALSSFTVSVLQPQPLQVSGYFQQLAPMPPPQMSWGYLPQAPVFRYPPYPQQPQPGYSGYPRQNPWQPPAPVAAYYSPNPPVSGSAPAQGTSKAKPPVPPKPEFLKSDTVKKQPLESFPDISQESIYGDTGSFRSAAPAFEKRVEKRAETISEKKTEKGPEKSSNQENELPSGPFLADESIRQPEDDPVYAQIPARGLRGKVADKSTTDTAVQEIDKKNKVKSKKVRSFNGKSIKSFFRSLPSVKSLPSFKSLKERLVSKSEKKALPQTPDSQSARPSEAFQQAINKHKSAALQYLQKHQSQQQHLTRFMAHVQEAEAAGKRGDQAAQAKLAGDVFKDIQGLKEFRNTMRTQVPDMDARELEIISSMATEEDVADDWFDALQSAKQLDRDCLASVEQFFRETRIQQSKAGQKNGVRKLPGHNQVMLAAGQLAKDLRQDRSI